MKQILKSVINKFSSINIDLNKTYKMQRTYYSVIGFNPLDILNKTITTTIMNKEYKIPIKIFFPKENTKKLIIYFHGGGWVIGGISACEKLCTNLSKQTNTIVVSVDYRLAPENPFPIGLEDCYKVVEHFFNKNNILNIESKDICLMGSSAGGNLVAAVSLLCRDREKEIPRKQILLYPITNNNHNDSSLFKSLFENDEKWGLTTKKIDNYMNFYIKNKEDLNNYYVAPLLCENLKNQPETLIITAALDPLRDEGEAYGKKLKQNGIKVQMYCLPDTIHGYFSNPFFPKETEKTYQYINKFIGGDFDA